MLYYPAASLEHPAGCRHCATPYSARQLQRQLQQQPGWLLFYDSRRYRPTASASCPCTNRTNHRATARAFGPAACPGSSGASSPIPRSSTPPTPPGQSREYRRRFRQAFAAPIGKAPIRQALIAFLVSRQARHSPCN